MGLKDSTIEKVRSVALTDILASEQIPFKKMGREAVTLCPWHADTHPSLTINDDKNLCFCFACGGGSDGISYVQQKFGLNFSDAVLRIAERQNIEVEYEGLDPEEALRQRQELHKALSVVKDQHSHFRASLRSEAAFEAREWLQRRGISPETSRYFELGLATHGYYSNRIIVPIHNHRGTIVGFTGRRLGDDDPRKYKNSPASQIFDKGALLFNEHRAAEPARLSGYMVFVEGHFDVIAMHQYGINNVVATQGTAGPTIQSLKRLMRQCTTFVLCYDGDDGGFKAVESFIKVAGEMACSGELNLTVAQLPQGMDPEDCIKSGMDLHAFIEGAPQWLDWQIDCWLAKVDRSDTVRFSKVEHAIRELVESIKSPALRQYYVDKSAKVLASDAKAAAKLAQSWNQSLPKGRSQRKWSQPSPDWIHNQAERRLLRSYIHFPETRQRLTPVAQYLKAPSHIWLWNRLVELEECLPRWGQDAAMAILVVAEPHYLRSLRQLVMPTIKLDNQDGILSHIEAVLGSGKDEVLAARH